MKNFILSFALLLSLNTSAFAGSGAMEVDSLKCSPTLTEDNAKARGAIGYSEIVETDQIANILEALAAWKFTTEAGNPWPNVDITKIGVLNLGQVMMVVVADKNNCVFANYNCEPEDFVKFIATVRGV